MTASGIWLGDDLGTHQPAFEPLGHMAVFGQTQRAGKTTTLRTLVARAVRDEGAAAIVIRTGRGELSFDGLRSNPFFRERLDWRSVEAMLWTFLAEKPKVYRPIVMKAVSGARSLEEVHRRIVAEGTRSRNGWVKDRTYELDQYLSEIRPWLAQHKFSDHVEFEFGRVATVDLEGWPITVQQLVIASTLEKLLELGKQTRPLIVVLPEGRNFIPSERATPAKLAADHFAREGAKLGLFLWVDSQSLTGVDQMILRNFSLLLQGVQTSDIEVRRICAAIDGVKPAAVRKLRLGDFIVSTQGGVRAIHVPLVEPTKEEAMDQKERREYEDRIAALTEDLEDRTARIDRLARKLEQLEGRASKTPPAPPAAPTSESPRPPIPVDSKLGNYGDTERVDLHVVHDVPSLTVHVREVRRETSTQENPGRVALLLVEGFFDSRKTVTEVCTEFRARGWGEWKGGSGWNNMDRILNKLAEEGFLRNVDKGYVIAPGAKGRVVVSKETSIA